MLRAALISLALLGTAGAAWAQPCFQDDGKPPAAALVGTLRYVRVLPPYPFPAMARTFYALDLSKPVCLNGVMSDKPRTGITSVHVYATDDRREALLKRYRGRRVAVEFASVFEEVTAHHQRPMVGAVEADLPFSLSRSVGVRAPRCVPA